jgi:subtilisin family serine protease
LIAASSLILAGLLILILFDTLRAGSSTPASNIAPQAWEATAGGAETDILVILEEQADLSAAEDLPMREERLRYVYDALRTTALRSQGALRAELDRAGVDYRSFYISNMIAVRSDRDLMTRLANRPEVARIVANPRVRLAPPEPDPDAVRSQATAGVEWNVARVNADDVWELGYTGDGMVVAGQDTGYDWDHPALKDQYRGYNGVTATHDHNWHDAIRVNDPHTPSGNPCGFDLSEPCDDYGHGTHTMGTMVGDDGGGNQIGVAPGARWIGCRNMEEGWGTPATYAECFEFFLAPYPVGGDPFIQGEPLLAPHVINNSWTCPPREGCDWDSLLAVVETVRAAGIVVVASAGNSGSSCGTMEDPPAIYDAAFAVGATGGSDHIAGFSARGPVTVDGSGQLKPDISAPGVGVRSSFPGTGYGSNSGTSMAGPHVAGTVALLWSAAPKLIGDVDATEWVIARTARPKTTTQGCGGDGVDDVPNNVYGWGIVDALDAVQSALLEVEIAKRVDLPAELRVRSLDYTLVVSNVSPFTLTDVALIDTIPLSTTFAWASGSHAYGGDTVTWTVSSLAPWETLTAGLGVSVSHLPRGSIVVNADYGVRACELLTPVAGAPVETVVPWHLALFPIFKDWQVEEGDDG